ncbi:Tudor/PWWP/MBT superfamily protein [Hirschfeldia incana]|nr:Tudor/PWWP/MBT superfamily protein [Hirschfeldia incana]
MLSDSEAAFENGEIDSESESKGLDVEETSKSENENVNSDEESENCSLEILGISDSDLVWGKVSSYPWWPGQVFLDPSVASSKAKKYFKKKETFLVAYFGDSSFAWNDVSKLKPFHQHFPQMVNQSGSSDEFRNAVCCALEEVSRRVEFGLSCGCVSEEGYYCERVKTQKVVNPGVREESRVRYGGDKASSAVFFEPEELVEYVKSLACVPWYEESDKLVFVSKRAQVLAFQRWTSVLNFPTFLKTEEETLSDWIADKSVKKKRKVESLESGKREKKMKKKQQKVGEPPCFLMGAIPLRTESEMTTHTTLEPLGDSSNSISKLEVEKKKKKKKKPERKELVQEKTSPPPDEKISSLHSAKIRKGTPRPLILEHSNYEDFEKFIEEMSCSNLNQDSEKVSITEVSEPSDVNTSSDQQNLPESGSKEEQTSLKDCSGDSSAPNALILKFASSGSVPSEEKLNGIFNRYGPLREAETRVMKKGKKARVVFRRGEDAETAFSSSGKYSIFGPSLLSYGLKYVCPKAKGSNET